jgi:hypothetical protein
VSADGSGSPSTRSWDSELIFVRLSWGARGESADQIARRLRETLALLANLVPGRPERLTYPTDLQDRQEACWAFVRSSVVRADQGTAEPANGYLPGIWVPAVDGSIAIGIEPYVGDSIPSQTSPATR